MPDVAGSTLLRLSQAHLADVARRGVPVPEYDRGRLTPRIVHVGVGGFHRAHLAVYAHELASVGGDWGIAGLGLLDRDAGMAAALGSQDHLYTLIEKGAGEPAATVIGSIVSFVHAPSGSDDDAAELIAAPDTAILSLTITEAGYAEPSTAELASRRRRPSIGWPPRLRCGANGGTGRSRFSAATTCRATATRHAGPWSPPHRASTPAWRHGSRNTSRSPTRWSTGSRR